MPFLTEEISRSKFPIFGERCCLGNSTPKACCLGSTPVEVFFCSRRGLVGRLSSCGGNAARVKTPSFPDPVTRAAFHFGQNFEGGFALGFENNPAFSELNWVSVIDLFFSFCKFVREGG